jgi:hypothetical protein
VVLPLLSYAGAVPGLVPVVSFWALNVRVVVELFVVWLDQLPRASRLQLCVFEGLDTVSRPEPLWPEDERVPRAKPVCRPTPSYAVLLSPEVVLLAW